MACKRTAVWNIIGLVLVFKYVCRPQLESHRWSWWTHLNWFCVSAAVEFVCSVTLCSLVNIYCWLWEQTPAQTPAWKFWYLLFHDIFCLLTSYRCYIVTQKVYENVFKLWPCGLHKADWCTFTAGINQLRKPDTVLLQAGSWKWLMVCPTLEAVLASTIIHPVGGSRPSAEFTERLIFSFLEKQIFQDAIIQMMNVNYSNMLTGYTVQLYTKSQIYILK